MGLISFLLFGWEFKLIKLAIILIPIILIIAGLGFFGLPNEITSIIDQASNVLKMMK